MNKLGLSWARLSTAEVELGLVLIELQLWLNLTKFACMFGSKSHHKVMFDG